LGEDLVDRLERDRRREFGRRIERGFVELPEEPALQHRLRNPVPAGERPQIAVIISIENTEAFSLDIEHELTDRGSGGEELHLLCGRESAVGRRPGAEVEAVNRAPLVDEDMLLAAGQILVRPDPLQDGKNVIIGAEERMQTVLYRVPLLVPTRQLAPDHRLACRGVQCDRGFRQPFPERYSGHKRGYAASDDCDFGRWAMVGSVATHKNLSRRQPISSPLSVALINRK